MGLTGGFGKPGRFYKGNIHTHSDRSDGRLPPNEVCRLYREAGYDFLSVTDHFLAKYDWPLTEGPAADGGFVTILGAELHAPATSNGEAWHILAVGLPPDFAPTRPDEDGPALARRAAAAGAFVGIAHPEWYGLTPGDAQSIDAAHAVEIYNHTSAVRTARGGGAYLMDSLLAAGRRIGGYAADDAHFHVDDAFGSWVCVKAASLDPQSLVAALKAGDYYSSQGPELHEIAIENGTLRVACSPVDSVFLLGRASHAAAVQRADMTEAVFPLGPFDSPYARIVLIDAERRHAWSNPVWLDDA